MNMDLASATDRALHIRRLYEQLEERLHGSAWTPQEVMIGFHSDVGELGRLVMAAEDRWMHEGDLPAELGGKLSECRGCKLGSVKGFSLVLHAPSGAAK